MPGFDGTGPQGRGPMTGRGMGFCVLRQSKNKSGEFEGLAGIQGTPISISITERKKVFNVPCRYGIGFAGLGSATCRIAAFGIGHPVPYLLNPFGAKRYVPVTAPAGSYFYNKGAYNYSAPYIAGRSWFGRGFPWLSFGRGFGGGRGFIGGRGIFGY